MRFLSKSLVLFFLVFFPGSGAQAAPVAMPVPVPAGPSPCNLEDAVQGHQRLDDMLSQKFDHYVYGSKPTENFRPLSLDTVIAELPPRAALLFYQLSSDEFGNFDLGAARHGESMRQTPPRYLCTWLIDRDRGLVAEAVTNLEPGTQLQAIALADGIRASLKRGDEQRGWRSPQPTDVVMAAEEPDNPFAHEPPWLVLHAASDMLLPRRIREALLQNGYQRLFVVPSRNLGSIPFAALPVDGERLLIDLASILVVPSFKAFGNGTFAQSSGVRGSLVVGDPVLGREDKLVRRGMFAALPGARDEAQRVAEMLGTRPLIGAAASQKAVLGAIRQSDIIYFATHGVANDRDPNDRSFLLLSDGALTAREIAKLKLGRTARIVVMSACQTGLGKTFESGVIGLAKAWHYAGVPTVVMTLWSVYDAPTRDLMVDFMKSLREGSVPADIALRGAMLKARERAPHPIYWSGFAVYGDPGAEIWNPPEAPATASTAPALRDEFIDEATVNSVMAAIAQVEAADAVLAAAKAGAPQIRPAAATTKYVSKGGTFALWYDGSRWKVVQERLNWVTFRHLAANGVPFPVTIETREDVSTVDAVKAERIAAIRKKSPQVEVAADTVRTVNGTSVTFVELKDANVVYDMYIGARGREVVTLYAAWDPGDVSAGARVLELFGGLTIDAEQPPDAPAVGAP